MAKNSTALKLEDLASATPAKRAAFGGGPPPPPPVRPIAPIGSNAWLAMIMFLGAEAMFFAGLMGAFLVFRVGSPVWPPPFQPRLPATVTGVNTLILLLSAVTMRLAFLANRRGERKRLVKLLSWTAMLGAVFLLIQGFEWVRLLHFGLTVSSSVYGGLFYTLIGFHGAHVLGALAWLIAVWSKARQGKYMGRNAVGLQTCSMYWIFVVALWPVLYGLVYLY
ncbi:MAG TPA: cytochrome c oxidase subunit 3 [Candidatus Binatia bacterium]|jgi:cytochrome c oxidase subunit III|nr:cytochrome c oxidase subunit 3 [Candidatus Binatia bacterium]